MKELRKLLMESGEEVSRETVSRICELIRTEEEMYTILVRVTNNFYLDEEDGLPAAWIFTGHSFAEENVRNLRDFGLEVREMEIPVKQRLGFFHDLFRSGIEAVRIDRGQEHSFTMSLFNLIERPDEKALKTMNPVLVRDANRFYQDISRNRATPQEQKFFSTALGKAVFLVPVNAENGSNPMVTNKAGGKYFAVFTDPNEFFRFDKKHVYEAAEVPFKELQKLAEKADGIVVNPFGFGLSLDTAKIKRILEEISLS